MRKRRYPKLQIRSKNELAKHIATSRLNQKAALKLINNVLQNYENMWSDHPVLSQPEKGKWVRNASGTGLGKLLKQVDKRVLKPHDHLIPNFIFGGLTSLNHKGAVQHLLGKRRKRIMLKLDISKFFEQIHEERVYHFFRDKCGCSHSGAKLLANLCCVSYGAKRKPESYATIARGFPTSPRLAVWCNLDTFLRIERVVKKELKGKDPRIAIYVDDIGITTSGTSKEDMMRIYPMIKEILETKDPNQKLPLNHKKTKIVYHSGETYDIDGNYLGRWGFEHLGLQMNRNSLTPGTKTRWKLANLTKRYNDGNRKDKSLRIGRKSLLRYKDYINR